MDPSAKQGSRSQQRGLGYRDSKLRPMESNNTLFLTAASKVPFSFSFNRITTAVVTWIFPDPCNQDSNVRLKKTLTKHTPWATPTLILLSIVLPALSTEEVEVLALQVSSYQPLRSDGHDLEENRTVPLEGTYEDHLAGLPFAISRLLF